MSEFDPTVAECISWLEAKYGRHKEWEDMAACRHLRRLQQYVEYEKENTTDESTCANLIGAVEGEYLYQHMPGWNRENPLSEPRVIRPSSASASDNL